MRSLVVGGAGFIGSHMVDALVERGPVTIYDNLSVGSRPFVAGHLEAGRATLVEADALDLERLTAAMAGHDIVVHLAANPEARWGLERTRLDLEQGTIATYNVVEAMRRTGAPKLIFSSSGTMYGETPKACAEGDLGELPISLYGASKFAGEALISAFVECFGLTAWIYRFGNVVGPRGTHGAALDFLRKLRDSKTELEVLGDGRQSKPYLFVTDCVDGMLFGLDHAKAKLNIHNLAPADATTVARIAELCIQASPYKDATIRYTGGNRGWPGDVPRSRMDPGKLAALGFSVRHSSDEAVGRAIEALAREVFPGDGWLARLDQVVVLAGGLGTRMLPRTERVPKVLLPVAGRPFAAWLLERLAASGLGDVLFCVAHLGDQVRRELGDGAAFGVRIRYADEGETLRGTAGALRAALPELAPTFLVTYGDSYLPFDYRAPLADLRAHPEALGTMAVYRNEGRFDGSNTEVSGNRVVRYEKGGDTRTGLDHIDYGATALRREVIEALPLDQVTGLDAVQRRLAAEGRLRAFRAEHRFFEIGSEQGLRDLESHLQPASPR